MNTMNLIKYALRLSAVAVIGTATVAALAQPAPEEPGPRDLRERVEKEKGAPPREGGPEVPRAELLGQLDKLRARLAEWRQQGATERALEARRRIEELEDRLGADAQPQGPRQMDIVRPFGPEGRPPKAPMGVPGPEERLRHLEVAIENLHAAGRHDLAHSVAREAARMRRQLERGPRPGLRGPGAQPVAGEIRQLHEQLQELRQAVQDLRRRLDGMNRERR